jgi:very-short-patch-repair endonuclease
MKLLKIDIDDAIRRYEAGESIRQIAPESGVSEMTLRRRLERAGAQIRTISAANRAAAWARYGHILDALIERYVAGETVQKLSLESGVNRRRIELAVKRAGHELRTMREAVGLRYARMSVSERRSITAKANIAKRGRKASESSQERRARTCEKTLQLASRADLILAVWLAQRGECFTPQKAVGPYNIDIAVDALLVAVEVNGDWHYFPDRAGAESKRREYLFHQGWRLVDVCLSAQNGRTWKYLRPACADKIVALLNGLRAGEPGFGQHCVIGGDGELLA